MDKLISQRFDIVMANLKPFEPSADFDFEFGRRLRETAVSRKEGSAFIRAAKLAIENIRLNILPETPVFVRVAAGFAFVFSVGLYIYGSQPIEPSLLSNGAVIPGRVHTGSVIATGSGETADIVLGQRYTVRVRENSRIKVAKLSPRIWPGTARFTLAQGNLLISVEKGFKGSGFVVDTGAGSATAFGTKFSVDVSGGRYSKTAVAVLEGRVKVASTYRPKRVLLASNVVMVGAGQKTEMSQASVPKRPERMMAEEWLKLEELYQIGKKPQVVLLMRNIPGRVYELLKPCPLYVSDEKPRDIPMAFDDAVRKIANALKTGNREEHLEAIRSLETVLARYPNTKYDPQILLYIGSYYSYMDEFELAIRSFERVAKLYPDSQYSSLALAAIGVTYEDRLKDHPKAEIYFRTILKDYPDTLEAILAEEKLGIKKVS